MNLNNIKEGMRIKNYKVMCELLCEKEKKGSSKISQLKEWGRHFSWHKDGNTWIINVIYETAKPKIDKRINGNNGTRKRFNRLKMNREMQDSKGIYAIYDKHNNIYIGSTKVSFRQRFHQHKAKGNPLPTFEMLTGRRTGGVMIPLFVMNDIDDEELMRMVENEFIKYYILQPEWNVVNSKESHRSNSKSKYKNIKVKEEDYIQALQLLSMHGYIKEEDIK